MEPTTEEITETTTKKTRATSPNSKHSIDQAFSIKGHSENQNPNTAQIHPAPDLTNASLKRIVSPELEVSRNSVSSLRYRFDLSPSIWLKLWFSGVWGASLFFVWSHEILVSAAQIGLTVLIGLWANFHWRLKVSLRSDNAVEAIEVDEDEIFFITRAGRKRRINVSSNSQIWRHWLNLNYRWADRPNLKPKGIIITRDQLPSDDFRLLKIRINRPGLWSNDY